MSDTEARIPRSLIEAVQEHRLVPFIGAGASMHVARSLFPSWYRLLQEMVAEMDAEGLPLAELERVKTLIQADEYVPAAELGFRALGAQRFHKFLRQRFRHLPPGDAQLDLVEALWALRPELMITTNYDSVLRWAGPKDVQIVANDQSEELGFLSADASPEWPWVWHLHGTIERMATVILAGSQYEELYGDEDGRGHAYQRALFELQKTLSARPLLFVGFGLSDPYVLQQIRHVLDITRGNQQPSYALLRRGEADYGDLWENHHIQLLEYADHGAPLVELVRAIAARAWPEDEDKAAEETPRERGLDLSEMDLGAPLSYAERAPAERSAERVVRRDAADLLPGGGAMGGDSSGEPGRPRSSPAVDSNLMPQAQPRPKAPPAPEPAPEPSSPHRGPAPAAAAQLAPAGDDADEFTGELNDAAEAAPPPPVLEGAASGVGLAPRVALVASLASELVTGQRLLLLGPRGGGVHTLAEQIAAARFRARTTWLNPPSAPECTEAEYCAFVSGDARADCFAALHRVLEERARAAGGELLVVLRHDGGPLHHLERLGDLLRSLLDEGRQRGLAIFALVAGGAPAAELRYRALETSLFSGAPVRHVPMLNGGEVAEVLAKAGRDRGLASDVWTATGGLPRLVRQALAGGGSLREADISARLRDSSAIRGRLHQRLLADDREQVPAARHARSALATLLGGGALEPLRKVEDELRYAEVRLYYDGLVRADENGATRVLCPAVAAAAERLLAREGGRG